MIAKVNELSKKFGSVHALDQVSFTLEDNKIYGLLGRNGAGKTTLMHLLTAQLFPSSGTIEVFGGNPYENSQVLQQICFIKESQMYVRNSKISDVLDFASLVFPRWDQRYANELLHAFQLPENRKIKHLSRGMLSSVGIVLGLASRAPLTIFDEPYLGLDAASRTLFYDLLLEDYSVHPRTIVLSTHLIDEVNRLLEHILVIDRGRLVLNDDADNVRGKAYSVSGPDQNVSSFVAGRRVIRDEKLGSLRTAVVMQPLDANTMKQAMELGLEIKPVSLQQMIVYLTGPTSTDRTWDATDRPATSNVSTKGWDRK